MLFRLLDNGGQTADRYTLILNTHNVDSWSMSHDCTIPNGVCIYNSLKDLGYTFRSYHDGFSHTIMDLGSLPERVQNFISKKLAECKA